MNDCPWDEGVRWFSRRTVEPSEPALDLDYVKNEVIRIANMGTEEDGFITACIAAAADACEKDTGRALMPQTWELVLDRFPYGNRPIVLPRLPLIMVESVTYIDSEGTEQSLATSPAEFVTVPSGEFVRGRITPLYGAVWPATRIQEGAVTVTFTCGYELAGSPLASTIPDTLKVGMGLMVAELYKQRSLSSEDEPQASMLNLKRFWRKVEG